MSYGLSEKDCENLRDGDVILIPFVVERTNNYFDKRVGMKIVCTSTQMDHRGREEREEKGPIRVEFMSRYVHSVRLRKLREGDWVSFVVPGEGSETVVGRIVSIEDDEVLVRRRFPSEYTATVSLEDMEVEVQDRPAYALKHCVVPQSILTRIMPPDDLTPAEQDEIKKARRVT